MIRQQASSTKLSARIIRYLVNKGFTQDQIARAIGLSPSMISHVLGERKALSLDSLHRIEEMLGMPLGAIILEVTLSDAKPNPKLIPLQNVLRKFMESADRARAAIKEHLKSKS
jgi:transcriptional regulator with XRE-family HTH domain